MKQSPKFWDRIAKSYSKRPVADEEAYQKKLQVTREYLRPDMEVLEFGCGTGSTAIVHAPHVKHIRAIDISTKMIEIAKGKADAANITNITFEQGNIDNLDVPDESLDVVLGLSILHLVESKEAVIAKVYGMLKPGGVFVSSTVCLGNKYKLLKMILPIGNFLGLLPLLRFISAQELQDAMTGAGFRIDHFWQPGPKKAVFIVAKKSA